MIKARAGAEDELQPGKSVKDLGVDKGASVNDKSAGRVSVGGEELGFGERGFPELEKVEAVRDGGDDCRSDGVEDEDGLRMEIRGF